MQKTVLIKCCAGLAVLASLGVTCLVLAADTPPGATRSAAMDQVKPKWNLGDGWVVETATLPIQVRGNLAQMARSRPIQWQFTVQKYEKVIGDDCYRVVVRCLLPGPKQPTTVLWIDSKTQTLRQVQTEVPVAGQFRMLTESYEFRGGQRSPVLAPLTALPVDLPFFQGNKTKGLEKFTYEANVGPAGKKALGDLGFAYEVEQDVSEPSAQHVKSLVPDTFTKDLNTRPVVEVRLRGPGRQVRQLWQAGQPWPIYTDNGTTTSRLVKVIPANTASGN